MISEKTDIDDGMNIIVTYVFIYVCTVYVILNMFLHKTIKWYIMYHTYLQYQQLGH